MTGHPFSFLEKILALFEWQPHSW